MAGYVDRSTVARLQRMATPWVTRRSAMLGPMITRAAIATASLLLACGGDQPADSNTTVASTSSATAATDSEGSTTHDGGGEPSSTGAATSADDSTGATTRPDGWSWRFEDGELGTAVSTAPGAIVDDSGNALHGTATGELRYVAGLHPDAHAIAFGGDGGHLALEPAADVADLDAGEPMQLALTFRTDHHGRDGLGGAGTLVARGGIGGDGPWWIGIVDGHLRARVGEGAAAVEAEGARQVADGVWHRAVVGIDRDTGELVIGLDGTDVLRAPAGLGAVIGDAGVRVGLDANGAAPWAGELDEIAFTRETPWPGFAGPHRDHTTVFEADTIPAPGGGHYFAARIPAVVVTPSGRLLAFAEGRVHNTCDIGNIDIVLAHSDDGGATWSDAETIVDPGAARVANPVPVVDATTGRVVLITMTQQLGAGCSPEASNCSCEGTGAAIIEARFSDDDGESWDEPLDITDNVIDPAGNSTLIGPSHGIQLSDGALLVPAMHRRTGDGKRGGHLLRSDDSGQSWSIFASETQSPVNVNESTAAELADGRVLVNTRHQLGAPDVTPSEVAAGLRGIATVGDDGSWLTDPPYQRVPVLRGPVVHGTVLAWPGSSRPGDARRLFFSLPAGEHGSNQGRRHDLRVWVSHDDGETWVDGVRVDGMWAAYSDLVAIDESHLGVLYEAGADANGFYRRVEFVRAAVHTLDEPTLAAWSFEGVADGAIDDVDDRGPLGLTLAATGDVVAVRGRDSTTAARFDGDARLCRSESALHSALDLGARDGFAIEVVFRTEAHGSGGATAAGTLISKTRTGTEPAWWLRIEDGHVRFLATACNAATINCGVLDGECDALPSCDNAGLTATTAVSDGAWHRVVLVRDVANGAMRMQVDDEVVDGAWPAEGVVKNDEPVCLGAFADGARGFDGELDLVRIRSRE